jgi:hypothetical protein
MTFERLGADPPAAPTPLRINQTVADIGSDWKIASHHASPVAR